MIRMAAKCQSTIQFENYTPGLGTLNAYAVVGQVDTVHGQVCHQGLC